VHITTQEAAVKPLVTHTLLVDGPGYGLRGVMGYKSHLLVQNDDLVAQKTIRVKTQRGLTVLKFSQYYVLGPAYGGL
jgi:hypothetical protein